MSTRMIPADEILRVIDDLETKAATEKGILQAYEKAGGFLRHQMKHRAAAGAYEYAVKELKKLL
ncbi:hypothetical protein [Paenibacillus sp. Pae108]|uniref:hypothetical protein n=1 Tax=Paenibacillus sp. Pae108 TaxID=2926019 RepID=UPI00211786E0|nr:hypothetical protein [Paenibacillus sp. Pae108]